MTTKNIDVQFIENPSHVRLGWVRLGWVRLGHVYVAVGLVRLVR